MPGIEYLQISNCYISERLIGRLVVNMASRNLDDCLSLLDTRYSQYQYGSVVEWLGRRTHDLRVESSPPGHDTA